MGSIVSQQVMELSKHVLSKRAEAHAAGGRVRLLVREGAGGESALAAGPGGRLWIFSGARFKMIGNSTNIEESTVFY